jgi:hypothetical protein
MMEEDEYWFQELPDFGSESAYSADTLMDSGRLQTLAAVNNLT